MATRKWGPEKLVNTGLTGNQLKSSIAGLTGGGYVVVWQDDSTADSTIRGQIYDTVGNKIGTELTFASAGDIDCLQPSVTALADGGFYLAFSQQELGNPDFAVAGAVYDANGTLVRQQNGVIFGAGFDRDISTARLGTGSVISWYDPEANGGDIVFRVFDAAGTGSAVLTANTTTLGNQDHACVAAQPAGSRFAIVWNDLEGSQAIRGRVFNAAGAEVLPEFTVKQVGIDPIALGLDPQLTWLNNGQFVVVWTEFEGFTGSSGEQIRAKIYNGVGAALPVTGDILVNSTAFADQEFPAVTALPSGGFAVAWRDTSGVGGDSDWAIRLQAFDGAGAKIGGEILVNTTTAGLQDNPSIAALADGRLAVSWTDNSSGSADVRTQIIDPRDGIVDGTAGADTLYGHNLVGDQVSGFAGNDALYGLNGNDGLHGGENNDILTGGNGDDEMFGGDGVDDMRGGGGADFHDGGAGIDIANYSASLTSVVAALDGSLVGTGDAAGDTFAGVEDVRGANIAGAGDTLRGNSGGNSLTGNAGNDILNARAGNDKLTGGAGTDTLTGELGNDQFIYNATTEGGDTVTDFASNAAGNNDVFRFKGSAFGGLLAGNLAAAQFQSSTANVAANTSVRFFYETDTRILRFDADGSGAGSAVVIATLQAGAALLIDDISIF